MWGATATKHLLWPVTSSVHKYHCFTFNLNAEIYFISLIIIACPRCVTLARLSHTALVAFQTLTDSRNLEVFTHPSTYSTGKSTGRIRNQFQLSGVKWRSLSEFVGVYAKICRNILKRRVGLNSLFYRDNWLRIHSCCGTDHDRTYSTYSQNSCITHIPSQQRFNLI